METLLDTLRRRYGEEKLYSMIRYPSILTYHNLGDRGGLKDGLVDGKTFAGKHAYITEKIDGSSSLICVSTDKSGYVSDYLIGSHTETLQYLPLLQTGMHICSPAQEAHSKAARP